MIQPKIRALTADSIGKFVSVLIGKVYVNCGFKFDEKIAIENVSPTIPELIRGLQNDYAELSLEEVEICFTNGWKRKYDRLHEKTPEILILSNSTFFRWLDHYRWDEDRVKAKGLLSVAKDVKHNKVELSPKEKEEIIRAGALACFQSFYETKILTDYGNVTYDYLDKLGKISFTAKVKKSIMAACKARLIEEEKMKKAERYYIGKHSAINEEIKKIEEGKSQRLISESKREALKQYFIQLIEMDEQLENLI